MHPGLPGLPWWGAVLLAVTATAIGFAFDAGAGHKELSAVFAVCYAVGCVLAVLAVQQAAVFTAVIQPPLILFVAVPGAYFLFHGGAMDGIKDLLINCGYPLIERFPLMFFTSAIVLVIGMVRWYLGMSGRNAPAEGPDRRSRAATAAGVGLLAGVSAKVSGLVMRPRSERSERSRESDGPRAASARRPRTSERPAREPRPASARSSAKRTEASRSRHSRPPEPDAYDPTAEPLRRPRPRRTTGDASPPAEPRRRPRSQVSRDPYAQPPAGRRAGYERPDADRFDPYERPEPRRRYRERDYERGYGNDFGNDFGNDYDNLDYGSIDGSEYSDGGDSGRGASRYDARRGPTHHPVSRARYRSTEDDDGRAEYRSRPRHSRDTRGYDS